MEEDDNQEIKAAKAPYETKKEIIQTGTEGINNAGTEVVKSS